MTTPIAQGPVDANVSHQPMTIEELHEVCELTVKLTTLRQNECKHLCIENIAPEIFRKLLGELHIHKSGLVHWSDCAMHDEPAYPNGPCDYGANAAVAALVNRFKSIGVIDPNGDIYPEPPEPGTQVFMSEQQDAMNPTYMGEPLIDDDANRWRWITRAGRTRELRIPATEGKESIDAAIDSQRLIKTHNVEIRGGEAVPLD